MAKKEGFIVGLAKKASGTTKKSKKVTTGGLFDFGVKLTGKK